MRYRLTTRWMMAILTAAILALPATSSASFSAGSLRMSNTESPLLQSAPGVRCVAVSERNDDLAAKMRSDIASRLRGRRSTVGLKVTDSKTGITCSYHVNWHFYAASVIKVTILAALLRKAQEQGRQLTATEKRRAWLMITQSDNNAATALWNDVGFSRMQHFLNVAKMTQTVLAHAWGLSLLTAHDETRLLKLLSGRNRILSQSSRVYAQYLMAHVISAQRWGVPAGAPGTVTVHLKNGWLPYPVSGNWEINSIGFFTHRQPRRVYILAMLTHENPTMAYGIYTIENTALVIHRDLNPGQRSVIPRSTPNPSWGIPDEKIPEPQRLADPH